MSRLISSIITIGAIALWGGFVGVAAPSQYRVESIEFDGAEVLSESELSIALEIAVGDLLDRDQVVNSAKAIQASYTAKGYWAAEVWPEVKLIKSEGVADASSRPVELTFRVTEGLPVRISDLSLTLQSELESVVAAELKEQLVATIDFDAGTIFTQDLLRSLQRDIEDELAEQGYVGGLIAEPKVTVAVPLKDSKLEASRWVAISLKVTPGQEVAFGFRGNESISRSELMSIIDDQRVLGLTENFSEEIRQQIEVEYRRRGFANIQVKTRTFEPNIRWKQLCGQRERHTFSTSFIRCPVKLSQTKRRVTFVIEEGPKVRIGSIDFEGNFSFTDRELASKFYEFGSTLLQQTVYVRDDVESSANALIDWMKSKGFLSAKMVDVSVKPIEGSADVALIIYLNEGVQTKLKRIKLAGVTQYPRERVLEMLGVEEGKPLDLFRFTEGIEALKIEYRNDTYLNVRVLNEGEASVVKYSQKNRLAEITLLIDEGKRYRVSRIQVLGLGGTKESVIRNEILFSEGDPLSFEEVGLSEARLRRIGIFSSVSIGLVEDPQKEGYKIVRIRIREGTPGYYGFTVGFRNDLGFRGSGEVGYANLFGLNHSADLDLVANRRIENYRFIESEVSFQYRIPHLGIPKLQASPSVNWLNRRFINFDAQTFGTRLFLARPLWKDRLIPSFTYNFELSIQENAVQEANNGQITIGSIIPGLRLDLRDSPLNPTNGFYADLKYEFASPFLGSQTSPEEVAFHRADYRMDFHYSFWRLNFYASFRTGWALNFSDDPNSQLPLIRQFWLGGIGSVRGYVLQDINFFDTVVTGHMTFVNYRFRTDFNITDNLKIGPFIDAGNLLLDQFSLTRNLRAGAGIGIRYATPVGPVTLDWGFRIDDQPRTDNAVPNRIHISVGVL